MKKLRLMLPLLALFIVVLGLPGRSEAQPFGGWLSLNGHPTHGYVQIPHSAALNPTGAITIEAWVNIRDVAGCSSIVGKDFTQAYWVGICGTTMRAYMRGSGTSKDAGTIPNGEWTHIAVTSNGSTQRHYINGELIQSFPVSGPLTTSPDSVRIGSDVSWQYTPQGGIDEVRIWNVARTEAQIRSTISTPITVDQPGLVAVWGLNGNANDVIGTHEGSLNGSGIGFLTFPVALTCGSNTATQLCLDGRFTVNVKWRTGAPGAGTSGTGKTAPCGTADSGLFWFFNAENWELLVKTVNGCGLNNRHWVFSAATTNVFYRMDVFDVRSGVNKVYFNYPGPPAPAMTDTSAFATCP